MMRVELTVNGQRRSDEVEPRLLLVHYLRETCGLRAANVGCDTTSCGACTVLFNGASVKSCTMLTVQAAGGEVTTAEGWRAADGELHPVQRGIPAGARPAVRLLHPGDGDGDRGPAGREPAPDRETQVRAKGWRVTLCWCTGYHNIIRAVLQPPTGGRPDAGEPPAAAVTVSGASAAGEAVRTARVSRWPMIPAPFDYVAGRVHGPRAGPDWPNASATRRSAAGLAATRCCR